MVYRRTGGSEVIEAEDVETPEPGPGELLVRMAVSGVNPTDWKSRAGGGTAAPLQAGWQIPNHDGAGRVVAVGDGVDPALVNERVWLWEAAYARPWGTAAQYTLVPAQRAVPLDPGAPYALGAALGVPFLTAHRCLSVGETLPDTIAPGALSGRVVLVQGGAGAVGNATIQLAHWAGATIISTVSSPQKAKLAEAAGSTYVIDYRQHDVVTEVRAIARDGVDLVVEVAAAANAAADAAVLGRHGAVAIYAGTGEETLTVPIRAMMTVGARWQFVLLYTMAVAAKTAAVRDVRAAVAAGAVRIGEEVGLPVHRFTLDQTPAAHDAVAGGAIGKVLIEIDDPPVLR